MVSVRFQILDIGGWVNETVNIISPQIKYQTWSLLLGSPKEEKEVVKVMKIMKK